MFYLLNLVHIKGMRLLTLCQLQETMSRLILNPHINSYGLMGDHDGKCHHSVVGRGFMTA